MKRINFNFKTISALGAFALCSTLNVAASAAGASTPPSIVVPGTPGSCAPAASLATPAAPTPSTGISTPADTQAINETDVIPHVVVFGHDPHLIFYKIPKRTHLSRTSPAPGPKPIHPPRIVIINGRKPTAAIWKTCEQDRVLVSYNKRGADGKKIVHIIGHYRYWPSNS